MTRGRLVFFTASVALVLSLVGGALVATAADGEPSDDSLFKYLSVFSEVLSLVRQNYVEQASMEVLMAGAMDGAADAMDPFTTYIPAAEVPAFLNARKVGSGRSGLTLVKQRGVAYVVAVLAGSPAAQAGLERGDIVAEIAGQSTRLMPLWRVEEILAGEPGRDVAIEILRDGETHQLSIALSDFAPPPPSLAVHRSVPVLTVPSFGPATATAIAALLGSAPVAGSQRLVIDLRSVAGGDPKAAYGVADLFVDGALGVLAGRDGALETFASDRPPAWHGQVVVLVDGGTLGPAEILANVLREKGVARLVGEDTFGYAGRQELAPLSDGSRLLYTEGFFTGPEKTALDEGLTPDVEVDAAARTFAERDESLEDLILERGLDTILEAPAERKRAA